MKRIQLALVALLLITGLPACNQGDQAPKQNAPRDPNAAITIDDVSYALGASTGEFAHEEDIALNLSEFERGLKEGMEGKCELSRTDIQQILQKYFIQLQAEKAKKNLEKSNAYLDSIAKTPGVQKDPSGLLYTILEPGNGPAPTDSSLVLINYKAKHMDGTVFDQSPEGQPVTLNLSNAIQGWSIGVPMLKEGGKAILYIPASLAYGERGRSPEVPGNTALVFDIELVHVLTPAEIKEMK